MFFRNDMDDRYDNVLLVVVPDKYTQPRITGYNNSRALIIRTWQICPPPPTSLPSALFLHLFVSYSQNLQSLYSFNFKWFSPLIILLIDPATTLLVLQLFRLNVSFLILKLIKRLHTSKHPHIFCLSTWMYLIPSPFPSWVLWAQKFTTFFWLATVALPALRNCPNVQCPLVSYIAFVPFLADGLSGKWLDRASRLWLGYQAVRVTREEK